MFYEKAYTTPLVRNDENTQIDIKISQEATGWEHTPKHPQYPPPTRHDSGIPGKFGWIAVFFKFNES